MKKILIVDDDKQYTWHFADQFGDDYDIEIAENLKDGKALLPKCDLALLDVVLDESNLENKEGLELLEWATENYPQIPVIVWSGHKIYEIEREARKRGAKYFISKPIDNKELKRIFKELLGE